MSKTVVYMLLVLALLSSAFAAELELTIHGEDGAPLSGVNVIHHELKLGASTSLDGMALVEHIPAGKHMFHISSVGYQSQMLELVFGENERVTQELILHSAVLEAAAVTVHGHSEGLVSSGTHMVEVQSTEALALNSGSTLDLLGEHEGVDTKPCALCGSAGVGPARAGCGLHRSAAGRDDTDEWRWRTLRAGTVRRPRAWHAPNSGRVAQTATRVVRPLPDR